MAYTYQLTTSGSVLRSDGAYIPADPMNADYQVYQNWIVVGNTPQPAATAPVIPNVLGFQNALKTALGGIVSINTLCTSYPLLSPAISQQVWADVQALIIDANTKLIINATQYAAIKTAAASNNIPITLP